MAYALKSTNALQHSASAVASTVAQTASSVYARFAAGMSALIAAQSRLELVERMNNLTDVELATKYGINRDGIVAYVFRDKMY